jgi:predicted kinase
MKIAFIQDTEEFISKLVSMSKAVKNLDMLITLKECDNKGSIQEDKESSEYELFKLDYTRETARSLGLLYHSSSVEDFYKYAWQKTVKAVNSGNPLTVVVPIGLSGAGKSTWVRENYPDAVIISRDSIREELGFIAPGRKAVLSRKQEDEVSKLFNQRFTDAARDGSKPIVLDNLNLKKQYRDGYKAQLAQYAVNWIYVYIQAKDLNLNVERRKGDINMDILKEMIMKFDWPLDEEYNKFVISVNGD